MGIVDRRRHQFRGLAAGIAEHDALVAGALVLVAPGIDARGDIGRLAVQQDVDPGGLPVEARLLVADGLDRLAGGGAKLGRVDHRVAGGVPQDLPVLALLQERLGHAHLAGDDDPVGRRQRLAGDAHQGRIHAGLLGFAEHQVDDLVGYAVADLVRMALGYRFRRKLIGRPRHAQTPENCPKMRKITPLSLVSATQHGCRSSEYKESFMSLRDFHRHRPWRDLNPPARSAAWPVPAPSRPPLRGHAAGRMSPAISIVCGRRQRLRRRHGRRPPR